MPWQTSGNPDGNCMRMGQFVKPVKQHKLVRCGRHPVLEVTVWNCIIRIPELLFVKIFFCVRVVQLWNKLPEEVVSASSVSAFISRLNSVHVSFFNVLFQCSCFIYLSLRVVVMLFEPFCPVDTVLLFTVFTTCIVSVLTNKISIHSFKLRPRWHCRRWQSKSSVVADRKSHTKQHACRASERLWREQKIHTAVTQHAFNRPTWFLSQNDEN